MTQATDPYNETCKYCPYARFTSYIDEDTGRETKTMRIDCDPPMGECRLEYESQSEAK